MTILNTVGMQRKPTHPGAMLREDFLPDYGLTVAGLAESLGVSRQSLNELLRERRAVSPEMALRLARLFGNSPEFWLNAQRSVDLWAAAQSVKKEVNQINPLMPHNGARSVARGGAVSLGVLLALVGLCLPQVAQANTGFGFVGVYVEFAWVMLLPVMLLEGLVVVGMLKVPLNLAADLVVRANLTSAAIGLVAAAVLTGVFAGGWPDLMVAWLVFWLSSVVIEDLVVRAQLKALMPQSEPLAGRARTFLAVLAGNTLSYVAILVAGDLPQRLTRVLAHWVYARGL